MCGSQYSSLLKRSENIKAKFEDSLDYLCVSGTSAPLSVAPRRVISAPHITAPTPTVYFYKKLQKMHICEIFSRKGLNCKNYGRSPRSRVARAGRPAAGRPGGPAVSLLGDRPPGTCAQFSPRFFFQKCPCRPTAPAAGRPGYIPVNFQIEIIFL